jgi:DNA-binding transcriptional LysR family regulator
MKTKPASQGPLSWDDLQMFLAVVQHGSVSGASRALGVNHSTVLRRIGSLEERLSARLFDRLPSGYALTEAGEELSLRLGGVDEQIASARSHVAGLDVEIKGLIRLASHDTVVTGLLIPLIARFRQRHPGVTVQILTQGAFPNLSRREADVAVRAAVQPPEDLVGRRVGHVQIALYASKEHVKAMGRQATPEDYVWVGFDEIVSPLAAAHWVRRNVPPERTAVCMDSLGGMVAAVAGGIGVGLLLCPLADDRSDLVQLAPPDPAFDLPIWILTHPDLKQVARIRAFTQFLFDELSVHPRLAH